MSDGVFMGAVASEKGYAAVPFWQIRVVCNAFRGEKISSKHEYC